MKIAIIVAMDKELALLRPLLRDEAICNIEGTEYYTGTIGGRQAALCKCGIGKVNAAIGALLLIDTFHPDIVINSGVAGGTGAGVNPAGILDVVLASEIAYHDVWCGPGTVRGQIPGFPARFECPLPSSLRSHLGAKEGLIASGDIFVDAVEDLNRILALYPDAMAVDMESAAIAQVCAKKDVPFVCLRVVSDTPGGEGNAAKYDNFWAEAPAKSFRCIEKLISLL